MSATETVDTTHETRSMSEILAERDVKRAAMQGIGMPDDAINAALSKMYPATLFATHIVTLRQQWIDQTAVINDAVDALNKIAEEIRNFGGRVPRRDENGTYHADPSKDSPTAAEGNAEQVTSPEAQQKRGRKGKKS